MDSNCSEFFNSKLDPIGQKDTFEQGMHSDNLGNGDLVFFEHGKQFWMELELFFIPNVPIGQERHSERSVRASKSEKVPIGHSRQNSREDEPWIGP